MKASIFKHYPLSIYDFDIKTLRLTDEESRQFESLLRQEKRTSRILENAHWAEYGIIGEKVSKQFIEDTLNPLMKETEAYRSKIRELLVIAVDRDFELKFKLDEDKIFNDV